MDRPRPTPSPEANESAGAGRVNPYAAPQTADLLLPEMILLVDRGVGVWRDGRRIVMHYRSELPKYCVVTGEPARFGYYLEIAWSYSVDISSRTLGLYVPFSADTHRQYRRRRWLAICVPLAVLGLAVAAFLIPFGAYQAVAIGALVVLFLLAAFAGLLVYIRHSQVLYFDEARGDYLWLQGADARFLDRLPEWNLLE